MDDDEIRIALPWLVYLAALKSEFETQKARACDGPGKLLSCSKKPRQSAEGVPRTNLLGREACKALIRRANR